MPGSRAAERPAERDAAKVLTEHFDGERNPYADEEVKLRFPFDQGIKSEHAVHSAAVDIVGQLDLGADLHAGGGDRDVAGEPQLKEQHFY